MKQVKNSVTSYAAPYETQAPGDSIGPQILSLMLAKLQHFPPNQMTLFGIPPGLALDIQQHAELTRYFRQWPWQGGQVIQDPETIKGLFSACGIDIGDRLDRFGFVIQDEHSVDELWQHQTTIKVTPLGPYDLVWQQGNTLRILPSGRSTLVPCRV